MNYSRRDKFTGKDGKEFDKIENEFQMLADLHNDHDLGRKGWTRAKFTAGSLLSEPVAGTLEFNGHRLYFTDHSNRHSIPGTGEVITQTVTVGDTTTETLLHTAALAANELHVGEILCVRLIGFYSTANAADTFTLRAKVGSTVLFEVASVAKNVTNTPLDIEFIFTTRSLGETGSIFAYANIQADNLLTSTTATVPTTVDTTAIENVTFTVEWGNALAGNTLSITQGYAMHLN